MKKIRTTSTVAAALLGLVTQVGAQIQVPSDGSDGAGMYDVDTVVDLSSAATSCDCNGDSIVAETCRWDCPSPDPGKGVYDPDRWAVVFKFTQVNVASAATVTFTNHPSGAPVVWLVQGDIQIDGIVGLDGERGARPEARASMPGPGGFRGGQGSSGIDLEASAGFGPGGGGLGDTAQGSGSFGTIGAGVLPGATYGNQRIIPLIGGSGGSGRPLTIERGGGAGGGAFLIAAAGSVTVNGTVRCSGGAGAPSSGTVVPGGSGGAIRLVADRVVGTGRLVALGGVGGGGGGAGRIRIEANVISLLDAGNPSFTEGLPGDPPTIWPPDTAPRLTPVALGGVPIPHDPRAMLDFPLADVSLANGGIVQLEIQAGNVPLGSTMNVRIVPKSGQPLEFPATPVAGGNGFSSMWVASIDMLPNGISAIQVRAELP